MTNLSKAVEILSELLANNLELNQEEYYKKIIRVFNETTNLRMEILNPSFGSSIFNFYHYNVEYDNTPIASILINISDPDEDVINLVSLIGVLIKNKHFYDGMKNLVNTINPNKDVNYILSYSEKVAVRGIFKDYETDPWIERTVIASKIADNIGITRSVIVNALRKLEMTGIAQTKSLGMKGTIITVLNKDSLNKFLKAI